MPSPLSTSGYAALAVLLGALVVSTDPVTAQQMPSEPTTGVGPLVSAVVGGLISLGIGGGLVALAPDYTERTTDRVLNEPAETFLYGLGLFVAFVVVAFLLTLTVVGVVLLIPIAIAAAVLGEIGYLAAARTFTDDWGTVVVGAALVGALTSGVPILGGLVGFVLGSMGIGAWYLDYKDDETGSGGSPAGISSSPGGTAGGTTDRSDVTDQWGGRETGTESSSDAESGTDAWGDDSVDDVSTDFEFDDGDRGDGGTDSGDDGDDQQ